MLIVDAILDGDETSLHSASRHLQLFYRALSRAGEQPGEESLEDRGRVLAFLDAAMWGIERTLSSEALASVELDTSAHAFLKAISERPGMTNGELAVIVETSDAEVSRVGRRLAGAGLVAKRRIGRRNHWEVTPKGLQTLDLLESGGSARFHRPQYQRYS
jgi:DNA-binding MarR family transcriptional regulator